MYIIYYLSVLAIHCGSYVYNCFLPYIQYITKHSFGELDP